MNAKKAIIMNGHVMPAFWITDSVSNILMLPCFLSQVQAQSTTNSQGATYKKLWSPSNWVVYPAVESVRTQTASMGAKSGRSSVFRSRR